MWPTQTEIRPETSGALQISNKDPNMWEKFSREYSRISTADSCRVMVYVWGIVLLSKEGNQAGMTAGILGTSASEKWIPTPNNKSGQALPTPRHQHTPL
jgi:hypothetical protein